MNGFAGSCAGLQPSLVRRPCILLRLTRTCCRCSGLKFSLSVNQLRPEHAQRQTNMQPPDTRSHIACSRPRPKAFEYTYTPDMPHASHCHVPVNCGELVVICARDVDGGDGCDVRRVLQAQIQPILPHTTSSSQCNDEETKKRALVCMGHKYVLGLAECMHLAVV